MAKISGLTQDQQEAIQSLKDFSNGAVTKAGYAVAIDPTTGFILTKTNTVLAKGIVKAVKTPVAPSIQNPNPEPKTQDVSMFWDMNGNALGNDAFSLVQPLV